MGSNESGANWTRLSKGQNPCNRGLCPETFFLKAKGLGGLICFEFSEQ